MSMFIEVSTDEEIDNRNFDKTKEDAQYFNKRVDALRQEILQAKERRRATSVKADWCEKDVYAQGRELVMEAEECLIRGGLMPPVKGRPK